MASLLNPSASVTKRSQSGRLALAVADAGWFTTENLFREVSADRASTLLLKCADYRVAWSKGHRPWNWNQPATRSGLETWDRNLVLPSGWMKTFPRLGMRPIARAIRDWHQSLGKTNPIALVMTYPHYLHLARMVRPARLVYFNIDDYRLYWPKAADEVARLERLAVLESDLTVCTSLFRANELRSTVPEAADRIKHLPHGAPSSSIPDLPQDRPDSPPADIAYLPRPLIGYVGTMEDRVDWSLVDRISQTNPTASIVLVGRVGDDGEADWQVDRKRCLARPNVHAVGWRGQDSIAGYNRSFDVALIPYQVDHPFNIACCPTKIMDTMAAGRPVVSTDLPECRLYPHLFDVVSPDDFVEAVGARLHFDDGRAADRLAFARENSCREVARRLLDWIG